ncbi:GCN5-related N-acetyltransferase [Oleidesulfovibrio alaskensis G20]|jgi:putative acetyltransferase|uniref:GCN5-related N-acetyltransferase n=2 Tax=Oleidesulfovibrio alaskensis TaxID=58180 RepID=Q30WX8_OLEA2|nr:GNAT family N-acetyltransferase [Oleidesulfovibrio alaskensis]ABB39818.1 GCN5-related N-acetyltransferase [Oleidesulfovibrio alaskensis G20]MBG0773431.1 GNAT family N-acetyltransferase [Oleidesulfovibrio alaskensis]MBL3581969.1 GNAT family N-acetyltransferase [Oleidesulfovibrio alaskensis]
MNIVAAAQEDYPEILAVWEASVRATHDFLTEDNIQFFKPLILKEYLPAVDLYCAKDETGRIHGFLGVAEQNIEMLFLAPESRGRGLGKLLVNFAVAELGSVRVDVNEQNPSAAGFYEHMGFTVVRRSSVDGQGQPFPLLHMELRK